MSDPDIKKYDDQILSAKAELIRKRLRDPNRLGEGPFVDEVDKAPAVEGEAAHSPSEIVTKDDLLTLWEWASQTGQPQIQAEIAEIIAAEFSTRFYGRRDKEMRETLKPLAAQAKAEGRSRDYVGLLEALIVFEYDKDRRRAMHEEARSIYASLADWGRELMHMYLIGFDCIQRDQLDQAAQLYLTIYQVSRKENYSKGIGMALEGLGLILERQGQYSRACRYLYRAKQVYQEAHSKFGIGTKEILSTIAEEHDIPAAQYQADSTADALIAEFSHE